MIIKHKNETFDITPCSTLTSQARGLMFRFPKNDGLLFKFKKEKKVALHMFFVFIPIDIVYLNKDKTVIKIIKHAKPFTPYIRSTFCNYILELKDSKNIEIGDKLEF